MDESPVHRMSQRDLFSRGAELCTGYDSRYRLALELVRHLQYTRWRQGEPGDTLRFHSLRLHQASAIKSSEEKLVVKDADRSFQNKLQGAEGVTSDATEAPSNHRSTSSSQIRIECRVLARVSLPIPLEGDLV
jgi:hypothetical protein